MNITFSVVTPCDFINDDLDDIGDIVYDAVKNYFRDNNSVEVESVTGTFSTNGKALAAMYGTATIDIDVGIEYFGDHGDDEDAFVNENSAIFEEFISKIIDALSELIESIDLLSSLPDARVIVHDGSLFVEIWNGQRDVRMDWSAPTVEFADDIEDTLRDLFYVT